MKTTGLLIILVTIMTIAALCFTPHVAEKNLPGDLTNSPVRQNASLNQASPQVANGKIYFNSNVSGKTNIYSINPDGSGQTRITNSVYEFGAAPDFEINADPSWSDAAQKLAFVTNRDGDDFQIYTMNADGSAQTRVTSNSAHDGSPALSRDGQKIAFARDWYRQGNFQIHTMNADGSGQMRLTITLGTDVNPAWSPTDRRSHFRAIAPAFFKFT